MNIFREYKIIRSILIPILALAIFLLPVSPSFEIKKAHALEAEYNLIKLNSGANSVTDTTANFAAVVLFTQPVLDSFGERTLDNPYKSPTFVKGASVNDDKYYMIVTVHEGSYKKEGTPDVTGKGAGFYQIPFTPNTDNQTLQIPLVGLTAKTDYFFSATIHTVSTDLSKNTQNAYENFTTTADANTKGSGGGGNTTNTTNQKYPLGCSVWDGMDGIIGCVAGFLYYVIWEVSALVAKLAGMFLDFLVYYSTNSTSYKSAFITKGWGAIRDVANIFFIIALLYIAIKMILSMADHHSKKLISTIIIVALLINFSLFFTQVIIDGSNILAKVFYNNIDQKYANGDIAKGETGEKSISVGLIDKYDPQKIINSDAYEEGRGTFIFVTILLIAITLYTAYIFFSVGLLFVSRVVMLWFSMIFAPIAFASYTLPFDIPGLGHKEWWKNLLENAFLAPLFIFMLYLVVMFTGELKNIINYPDGANWMIKMMSTIIPFVLLSVLLMKAKEMAVKYAGEMGAAMVKGAAVIGGLALGGAAMGAATLGRNAVGKVMQKASRSESARRYEIYGGAKEEYKKGNITAGQLKLAKDASGVNNIDKVWGRMGYGLNKSQKTVEMSQHARHELDKEASARYNGKKFKELSGTERDVVIERITKDEESQSKYGKAYKALNAGQKAIINREVATKKHAGKELKGDEYLRESKHKQGTRTTLVQAMRTGSWDVRELSKVTASEYDKVNTKFLSGLTSVLGSTMRGSIKSTFGAQYGSSQKHFFKDLGHTVSEAMKGAKINVDLSHVGEEKKEGHGGGGGGGHH